MIHETCVYLGVVRNAESSVSESSVQSETDRTLSDSEWKKEKI